MKRGKWRKVTHMSKYNVYDGEITPQASLYVSSTLFFQNAEGRQHTA